MSDAITGFFGAWGETGAEPRAAAIKAAMADDFVYIDPRVPGPITSLDALADYVGQFSANAPGWSARAVKTDVLHGHARVLVAFGGKGPDGSEMVQHGTYFAEMAGDRIARLVGFVGTGAPE